MNVYEKIQVHKGTNSIIVYKYSERRGKLEKYKSELLISATAIWHLRIKDDYQKGRPVY